MGFSQSNSMSNGWSISENYTQLGFGWEQGVLGSEPREPGVCEGSGAWLGWKIKM